MFYSPAGGIKIIEPTIFRLFSLTSRPKKAAESRDFSVYLQETWGRQGRTRASLPTYIFFSFTSFALLFYYSENKSKYKQSWIKSILIHPWTWTRFYNLALLMFRVYKEFKNGTHYFFRLFCQGFTPALSVFLTEHYPNLPCQTAFWVWACGPLPNCNFLSERSYCY